MKKEQKSFSNFKSKKLNPSLSMPIINHKKYNLKTEKYKLYDFNLYNLLIENSMKKYRVNQKISIEDEKENKNDINSSKKYLTKKEIKNIEKITHINHLNKTFSQNNNKNNKDDNSFKVSIRKNILFLSPIHSLGILKLNNKIYDDINKNSLIRQEIRYNESIKNIKDYQMKFNIKMPKIKIIPIKKDNNKSQIINKLKKKENEHKKFNINQFFSQLFKPKTRFFSYYKYAKINSPECREQFTLNLYENYAYLTGGMCTIMKQINIWILNIKEMIWEKLKLNNHIPNRFGHSCIIDKNRKKLYIFGGRTKIITVNNNINNNHNNHNNFINSYNNIICGLDIYNLNNNNFSTPIFSSKKSPLLRRNHICELIGNFMIIHGGITENNEILNDVYLFNIQLFNYIINKDRNYNDNLINEIWNKLILSPYSKSPYLYGHSASLVIPKDIINNTEFSIYKYPEISYRFKENKNLIGENKIKKINIQGWYIFGGKTKNESNNGISNDLYILKIGIKPCEWIKCDNTKGKKPCPRYFHSMNYYENGNFIIIHGGRNDNKSDNFALNDTFILNLQNLNWIEIELYSQFNDFKIFSRCGHCSIIYNNQLIICGGMNNNNYIGSSLLIVNLDEDYNPVLKTSGDVINDYNNEKQNNFNDIEENNNILSENINNHNQIGINLPEIK